jgi:dTDP-4-dehydrorhamnose reductase
MELDISNVESVQQSIDDYAPDILVNLEHFGSPLQENEPNRLYKFNAEGAKNLALVTRTKNIPIVHVSSDAVVEGSSIAPLIELHATTSETPFSHTVLEGENSIALNPMHVILRVPRVISNYGQNFLNQVFEKAQSTSVIECISDYTASQITSKEVVRALDKILLSMENLTYGIFHVACRGMATDSDIATEAFRLSSVSVKVIPVSKHRKRETSSLPDFRILDTTKFQMVYGFMPIHWKNALLEILSERKKFPVKVGDKVILGEDVGVIVSMDWSLQKVWIVLPDTMEDVLELQFDDLIQHD